MHMPRIGVDEAGRGPLAGPVAVGAVLVPRDFPWRLLPGVNDSKQVSAKKREAIFMAAKALQRSGHLDYRVTLVGPSVIDRIGIAPSVRRGVARTVRSLARDNHLACEGIEVLLDGALAAPDEFVVQHTIIGGDSKERCIGLASILAKVTRDRFMVRLAARYPEYGFDVHKGYGTSAHRAGIQKHGMSAVHRQTFCTRLLS